MLYLAHWARKLSWKETALSFRTTWDQVCQAVEYVVQWGLEHRELGSVRAIGVDEIQLGRGHHYLTLVYQIEVQSVRLLWVGKERTTQGFEQFFTLIGRELAAKIEFVCSDMMVSAEGHVPLTTHIFVANSPYIDEDVVFGKRDSLVVDFAKHSPGKAPDGREMTVPYHSASYDFRLAPTP